MSKLGIDTAMIEALAELLQRTGLSEIEVSEGDARIRVARQTNTFTEVPAVRPAAHAEPAQTAAMPAPAAEIDHPGAVKSPMVGTVYLSPEPGAPPFVTADDIVSEGQTLLIIEAMKVMNPIRAPRDGRISRIFVRNADPVEYGEVLLTIE